MILTTERFMDFRYVQIIIISIKKILEYDCKKALALAVSKVLVLGYPNSF